MSSAKLSDDFKRDAVAQITERGYPVRKVAERQTSAAGHSRPISAADSVPWRGACEPGRNTRHIDTSSIRGGHRNFPTCHGKGRFC